MIKIYAKKAYRFAWFDGAERVMHHDVPRGIITPVPDWVGNDPLFKIALGTGNLSVIGIAGNVGLNAADMLMNEAKTLGIKNPGTLTLDALQIAIAKAKQGDTDPDAPVSGGAGAEPAKKTTKNDLVAEAAALGIDRPGRLNVEQLQSAIAQVKAAAKDEMKPLDGEGSGGSGDATGGENGEGSGGSKDVPGGGSSEKSTTGSYPVA